MAATVSMDAPVRSADAGVLKKAATPRWFVVEDAEALGALTPRWEALVRSAGEPNPFLEPWFFLPALALVGTEVSPRFVFTQTERGELTGFFPLIERAKLAGLPVRSLAIWEHDYAPLGTPLVHAAHAHDAWRALFDSLEQDARLPGLLELGGFADGGPVHHAYVDTLRERALLPVTTEIATRGFFDRRTAPDADAYLARKVNATKKRKFKSKESKLSALGAIAIRELDASAPPEEAERFIQDFLELEASGWKGREGTAMATRPGHKEFFEAVTRGAHKEKKLHMLALSAGGRPVAMKCNFESGGGSFAFKIAYDESLSAASPGLLLELENVRVLYRRTHIQFQDSCAHPDNRLFLELWDGRRTVTRTVLAVPREPYAAVAAALPLLRWGKRAASRLVRRLRGG